MLATYRLDDRTHLRLSASRRPSEDVTLAFLPTETLLTTESSVLPNGIALDDTEVLELDFERYLSPGELFKLFIFRTESDNLVIGSGVPDFFASMRDLELNEVTIQGVGVRYERQVCRNMFGNLSFVWNDTSNNTPGAVFDGDTAPYQPKTRAALGLDYVDGDGSKARLRVSRVGGSTRTHRPLAPHAPPSLPSGMLICN